MRSFVSALTLFALTSVALMGCAADATTDEDETDVAVDEAEATTSPRLHYETQGGFTLFNFTIDVKPLVSGKATVTVVETFHRSTTGTLTFTDTLSAASYRSLVNAIPSNFNNLPSKVYSGRMIPDLPTIVLGVGGKKVSKLPAAGTPLASASFDKFATKMSELFQKVTSKELVTYDASGGFAFLHTHLTIKNSGECHLTEEGFKQADKDCYLDSASLIALKSALEAKTGSAYTWNTYASSYVNPNVADGYTFAIRWSADPAGAKTVKSSTAATEPSGYANVRTLLQAAVTNAEAQ